MIEDQPINIQKIQGCLLNRVPTLERSGQEILCTEWKNYFDNLQTGEVAIDDVDEKNGTASCEYSQCIHCATPNQ